MNFRTRRREEPVVNLTPLIDVILLLVIFFAVTTTFNHQSALHVDLPEADAKPEEQADQPVTVTIDAQGRYYVQQQQLINTQVATLRRAIQLAAGERSSPPLVISADAKTPHQAVVTAMDAARQLGIVRLSIATRQSQSQN